MPRAFVTGGSGFVGGALIRRLCIDGSEVIGLARSERASEAVRAAGGTPVPGDVLDPRRLADGMRGCEVAFHAAGVVRTCLRDPSGMVRTNVEGTRNVLRAAADAGVARVVLTSSAATIGERRGEIGAETTRHRGWFMSAYERSKHRAEQEALEAGRRLGFEVVVVNPASVQGPGRAEGSAALLRRALRARVVPAIHTWISLVDVDDCAAGHVLAAARGRPGERYILCGASLPARALFDEIARALGRPVRSVFVPSPALTVIGWVGDAVALLPRARPPLCTEVTRSAIHGHRYDGSRASYELGLSYTPLRQTLQRTARWFREVGLLGG